MNRLATSSFTKSALRQVAARPAAYVPARVISTQSMDNQQALEFLNARRAERPSSPWHIYQPQLTSMSSIANRATGAALSAAMYALFLGHLGAPLVGAELDSAALLESWAALPGWAQLSAKAAVVGPAAYHTLNGFRHLGWDMGYFLQLKSSYMAGYAVLAGTAVSTAAILAL
ncbi:cytochrome b560 subunit of succinate dehydrogenase [Rhodotorula diobovata]|uniref:Cytochrome b560 subunit of succinate dehydrogenase n=1 Tax=Rhodotorula diobovata TaxID=5288 RepID=A0A5C5FPH6_9BASI|nr:cytochrome b560 subunit of succinate dehydrogenase [Rhodotorula diobovata]